MPIIVIVVVDLADEVAYFKRSYCGYYQLLQQQQLENNSKLCKLWNKTKNIPQSNTCNKSFDERELL